MKNPIPHHKYSRKISRALRHDPDFIGITLDKNGWASVSELLEKVAIFSPETESKHPLSMEVLTELVENPDDKKRFTFNDDKTKIRALHGHSVEVELEFQPSEPPAILFHGTASKSLQSIKGQGLIRGGRQFVHLSEGETMAKSVGSRHGAPVILKVKSAEMFADGFKFFSSENGVWLTDKVPLKYLVFP
jgi:putative RNA 2'-phosphotransferase